MNYRRYTQRNLRRGFLSNLSITGWLILINILCFIVFFSFIAVNSKYLDYIALKPSNILQGKYLWTMITHMFMHGGFFHLFVNMFVLFSLGSFTERIIGRKRFLGFYLISGVFAALVSVVLSGFFGSTGLGARLFGSPEISSVGASGAIFAVAGLFIVLLPHIRFSIIFFPFFSLPGYIMVPLVLVLTWIATLAANLPIGNSAHFGGFLIGLAFGFYLRKKYKRKVAMINKMFRA